MLQELRLAKWLEQVNATLANTEEVSFDTLQELLETGNSLPQKTGMSGYQSEGCDDQFGKCVLAFGLNVLRFSFTLCIFFHQLSRKQSVSFVLWLPWANAGKKRPNFVFKRGKIGWSHNSKFCHTTLVMKFRPNSLRL